MHGLSLLAYPNNNIIINIPLVARKLVVRQWHQHMGIHVHNTYTWTLTSSKFVCSLLVESETGCGRVHDDSPVALL